MAIDRAATRSALPSTTRTRARHLTASVQQSAENGRGKANRVSSAPKDSSGLEEFGSAPAVRPRPTIARETALKMPATCPTADAKPRRAAETISSTAGSRNRRGDRDHAMFPLPPRSAVAVPPYEGVDAKVPDMRGSV